MSLPCKLMYLPSAGGIAGSFATVRFSAVTTTSRPTSDQTPKRRNRRISVQYLEPLGDQRTNRLVHRVRVLGDASTHAGPKRDASRDDRHLEVAQRHIEV